jgi:heptosyltransferase-2
MLTPRRALVVRLRNWVGDVVLGLPALVRLADAGYDLTLVGKGWARDLLAGHGWPVEVLPGRLGERVALLRALRRRALAADAAFGEHINALCFPDSFSSALEFRLAGYRALGHSYEARGWLLSRSLARPRECHELEVYWALADALLGGTQALPASIELVPGPAQRAQAAALCARHGIQPGSIFICPFAGGTWDKLDKTWPEFAAFVAEDLPALGRRVVVCPGPGEGEVARRHFSSALCLEGVGLGTFAALLAAGGAMVSNDTGPGHLAAAVGAPLVSVLGPSDPAQWRAWGPRVTVLGGAGAWPTRAQVLAATRAALTPAGG